MQHNLSPLAVKVQILDGAEVTTASTGTTPMLNAIDLKGASPTSWSLTPKHPLPKTYRSDESDLFSKCPKVSPGDIRNSRTQSLDKSTCEDAELASADVPEVPSDPSSQKPKGSDSDNDSDGDDMLARMAAAARQRVATQQPSKRSTSSNPGTPVSARRQPNPASAPPAVPAPRMHHAPEPEDGWDSVGLRGTRSRKATESGSEPASSSTAVCEGANLALAAKPAPAAADIGSSCISNTEELDDFAALEYEAAKDGSRRVSGKHSRSVRQTIQREYAIAARNTQRRGGRNH